MPIENTKQIKAVPDDGQDTLSLKTIEELCLTARQCGATDDAEFRVNVFISFDTPARVREGFVLWR